MNDQNAYRQPLVVYVIWHPAFARGQDLASAIYRHICNDPSQPSSRRIGIPVRFRTMHPKPTSQRPFDIPFSAATTGIIVLVDDELVDDDVWGQELRRLTLACDEAGDSHRLYPIAMSSNALSKKSGIDERNFIRLHTIALAEQEQVLLNRVTHELSRVLLRQPTVGESEGAPSHYPPPVKVFLSHAKVDGLDLVTKLRDYIHGQTQLNTFFDAHDIPPSTKWKEILRDEAQESRNALLILHTDAYSSREWCRIEALQAKLGWVPSLVVSATRGHERRSFPYLGNLPTIPWRREQAVDAYEEILGLLLYEVLRAAYFPLHVSALAKLYGVTASLRAIPYPPELLTTLTMTRLAKNAPGTVFVCPDPPLPTDERLLLSEAAPHLNVITACRLPRVRHIAK